MAISNSDAVSRRSAAEPPVSAQTKGANESVWPDSDEVSPTTRLRQLVNASAEGRIADAINAGLTVFEQCGIGFLICDPHCRVLAANRVARAILARHDGLKVDAEHVLSATEKATTTLAEAVIGATTASKLSGRFKRAVLVSRPQRKQPLTVVVQSTDHSHTHNSESRLALLFIMDATLTSEVSADEFRQMYGFTTVEGGLANLLMEGRSLGEACDRLGIRRSTGCSHLKRMFKKTGLHRQSQLVASLLKSIGLLRCGIGAVEINSGFGLT